MPRLASIAASIPFLLLVLAAPFAQVRGGHWCSEVSVTVTSREVVALPNQGVAFLVRNSALFDTNVSLLEVRFPWDTSYATVGSGVLPAGEGRTWTAITTPESLGPQTVSVRLTGHQGDPAQDQATCEFTVGITVVESERLGALGRSFGVLLAILVVIGIVAVVLTIVAWRKRIRWRHPRHPPPPPPPSTGLPPIR